MCIREGRGLRLEIEISTNNRGKETAACVGSWYRKKIQGFHLKKLTLGVKET